jgi:GNAT superfamily N-acetyltransferase
MLTLAIFMLPTGVRAWIEDVVVDDGSRGAGVASALVAAALEHARKRGPARWT